MEHTCTLLQQGEKWHHWRSAKTFSAGGKLLFKGKTISTQGQLPVLTFSGAPELRVMGSKSADKICVIESKWTLSLDFFCVWILKAP